MPIVSELYHSPCGSMLQVALTPNEWPLPSVVAADGGHVAVALVAENCRLQRLDKGIEYEPDQTLALSVCCGAVKKVRLTEWPSCHRLS